MTNQSSENKKVLITGTSSGIGLRAMESILRNGWEVIAINRSVSNTKKGIEKLDLSLDLISKITHIEIDISDLEDVEQKIRTEILEKNIRLDAIICNAAVYNPRERRPLRSKQGFELSMATNHLGHFLIIQMLINTLTKTNKIIDGIEFSPLIKSKIIILGSVTANISELGGRIPIPAPADLGDLSGFYNGFLAPISMANGKKFKPGKAYKDSKLCNMITTQELHKRYFEKNIVSMSIYPGCVAKSKLFRTTPWFFRWLFPLFQKYITGGFVSQRVAGERIREVLMEKEFELSGSHWSWGNRQNNNRNPFPQRLSNRITDEKTSRTMWDLSLKLIKRNL